MPFLIRCQKNLALRTIDKELLRRVRKLEDRLPSACCSRGYESRCGLRIANTGKAIALDQAFVEFTPRQFRSLTLTGGKFRYPWYNTELTWDKDLNPEGVAQTLAFNLNTPVLKRVALIGFELPFAEIAGTAATDKKISQQITYGGQLQTSWRLAPRVTLSAYSGFYDFRGADAIALALARASSKNPQTPLTGLLPLNSSSPVPNSTYTTAATTVVTIGGTAYPTGVTSITNAQFASRFGLFDNIARFDIDTGHSRLPLSVIATMFRTLRPVTISPTSLLFRRPPPRRRSSRP